MPRTAVTALAVSAAERGTPEAVWLDDPRLEALPRFAPGSLARVVVLAPHPDDEVLGVGGWLSGLRCAIDIVAVTDGEASHPGRASELGALRAHERAVALARLGVATAVVRLGCADGGVAQREDLPALLAPLVRGASLVVAPWTRDGHPDHDATGAAAVVACRDAGVRLVSYPIWAWHWATPATPAFPWSRARRIDLSRHARAAKRSAVTAFTSQTELRDGIQVLPASVLAHFQRDFEVVFA